MWYALVLHSSHADVDVLQGSHILRTLLALSLQPTVHAIARRDLSETSPNLKAFVQSDSAKWPEVFSSISPPPNVFLSALGTTRGKAGGVDNQRKIDYDLNLALAKGAKESGVKVYVLISSAGISKSSPFAYGPMKVELEEAVEALGFTYTVILRPGFLLGARKETSALPEKIVRNIVQGLGMVSKGLMDGIGQDADVVAKAAVAAGMQCVEGKKEAGVWRIDQAEVVRLGRTEWTGTK